MKYDTHENKTIPMVTNPNFIWKDHRLPNDVPGLGKTFLMGFLFPALYPCNLYEVACFPSLLISRRLSGLVNVGFTNPVSYINIATF